MTSPQIITNTNKRVMSLSDHYRQVLNRKLPPKGDFYEGGYYIADITYGDGRKFGIIVAPKSGGEHSSGNGLYWKYENSSDVGVSDVDDGFANSNNINNVNYPAGNFCRSLSIGGYTDWYLPSINELRVMYDTKYLLPSDQLYSKEDNAGYFWSSTQGTTYTYAAFRKGFRLAEGTEYETSKYQHSYVRAIRRFPLN